MLTYILNHPWLLALAMPPVLAAIPPALAKMEKAAIARLFAAGDSHDQKFIKAVVYAAVVWAEEKYDLQGQGAKKFTAAAALLRRALPFLTVDQAEQLIEKAILQMDAEARADLGAAAVPVVPQGG